ASAEASWWQRVEGRAAPLAAESGVANGPAPANETIAIQSLPHGAARPTLPVTSTLPAMSTIPSASVANDDASRLGQAVHRVLEWAALSRDAHGESPRDARVDLPHLANAAALEFGAAAAEVGRIAGCILASPACEPFFDAAALHWAGNEVSVVESGEVLRIDRLVARDEGGARVWWVLDYKLQHAPEMLAEHREQLLRYVRAVRALQPGAAVRCAFVTGAGAVVEIDAAAPAAAASKPAAKARN
ncbi:MAG: PD-(D/E)XK nuclease family protein, partial [Caldimonas sp.]